MTGAAQVYPLPSSRARWKQMPAAPASWLLLLLACLQVPTPYYLLCLGKHLKYSSCLYLSQSDSLDTAELNMLSEPTCAVGNGRARTHASSCAARAWRRLQSHGRTDARCLAPFTLRHPSHRAAHLATGVAWPGPVHVPLPLHA